MKKMKRILAFLLAFTLTFGCMSGAVFAETGTKPADGTTQGQPFVPGTGGSNRFRIPCMVTLNDGTIVAGCDARWTTNLDGGGLDTIISSSEDNGATWNYTFANYLGDDGNQWSLRSTAFIDPALATDGETLYLIADLFPAGISLNATMYQPVAGQNGLNEKGELILAKMDEEWHNAWDEETLRTTTYGTLSAGSKRRDISQYTYTLVKNDTPGADSYYNIKDADDNVVSGYTVDAYFNIRGENVDTNLFCADSPFQTWPTDYLYFTTSSDGGKTWSVPALLNMKRASEQTLLIGPGRGLVTSTGRIVFTAYEFTNSDRNSVVIYSDDDGQTWTRGASAPSTSSEATVVEANNKLYMFTRHGGYYVSDDWGATWSAKKTVGATYNESTQLSAITYSEKIDGKTAILLSAPSNTGSRAAGKIFVGLVQDDDSIAWPYEYSVNGPDYYAYSCLTELSDGSIGLLYENDGTEITYVNIPITDITDGQIGDIWFEDTDGAAENMVSLKPGVSATFTVEGVPEGATLTVASGDSDVASVSLSGNTVTVTGGADVTGLGETTITAAAGEETAVLKVYVTSSEQYEIVNLHMGDTTTYTDETGDYSDTTDTSTVDGNVARVTVAGIEADQKQQAQLATAAAAFGGEKINIEDCLYTFTSTDTENQYTVSAAAGGTTVYLNTSGGQIPNSTTQKTIEVLAGTTTGTFKLKDLTGASNGSAAHLHFFYNNTGKLYFDRCGNSCGLGDEFELYKASSSASSASPIRGYEKISSLSDIQSGSQYLIVRQANDGNYYLLRPYSGGSNFNHVAKVGEIPVTEATVKAQLASAEGDHFDGATEALDGCLYTFTKADGDNTYTVSGTTAGGTTVYLQHRSSGLKCPNGTTSTTITVAKKESDASFSLFDNTGRNGGYLYFHKDAANLCFNRNSTAAANNCYFELYEKSDDAPEASPIAGYAKVESLAEITNGGKYLIAVRADDGNYYLLHPYSGGSSFNHVAKVTLVEPNTTGSTEITIEAVGEGKTSVQVGDVTYYINVENVVKNIILEVGESYNVPGTVQKTDENSSIVSTEKVAELAPYHSVDAVTSGGKYLIANGSYMVINSASTAAGTPQGLAMARADFENGDHADNLWLVTADGNGYTIQDVDGNYMSFSGQNVQMSETSQTLTIGPSSAGDFKISNGGYNLNNWSRANNRAAGYTGDDCGWKFYEPSSGIELTGETVGSTVMTIGNVNYNITVVPKVVPADYTEVDAAIDRLNDLEYSADKYSNYDAVTEAIDAVDRSLTSERQSDVDAMAQAINDAINNLTLKGADYTAVDAAIAAAEALNPEDYKDFSGVTTAVEAVDRTKVITEQSEVDAMAQAITDAIAALELKDELKANYSEVDAAIARANGLTKDNYVDFSGVEAAINAVVRDKTQDEQSEVDAMAAAINDAIEALVLRDADYTAVDEAIARAEAVNKDYCKDFSGVQAALDAVVRDKKITEQAAVDAMAQAINTAIDALEYKDADYSRVDAAIKEARNLNVNNYKDFSGVTNAVAAVVRGKNITEQAAVDAMAQAINDAIAALELKDADYSRVDALLEAIDKLNRDDYKDFSGVDAAVAAVVRGKNITEQSEVDAMARALTDAVIALQLKDNVKSSDKTQLRLVYEAYSTRKQENYTEESWNEFQKALKNARAVLDDPNATPEQIAKALKAMDDTEAGLKDKTQTPDNSGSNSGTSSGSNSGTSSGSNSGTSSGSNSGASSGTVQGTGSNAASSTNGSLKTGDNAQTGLYVFLMLAAVAVIAVIYYKKKKDEPK